MILSAFGLVNHGILVAALVLLCLQGTYLVWGSAQFIRLRGRGLAREAELLARSLPPDVHLPHVLVQVPIFNEGEVIRRIAGAVGNLDWPRDKLHIQILDDSTDRSAEIAREAVAALRSRGVDALYLHRRDRRGFKSGAMQSGLLHSDCEYVAIFDADFVPPPDYLRRCLRVLLADADLAFVQSQLDAINENDSILTRAQQPMIDASLGVHQAARSWSGHIVLFSGTCAVWRRSAINELGGWISDIITEDVDISYRALLRGRRGFALVTVAVPGEVPATLAALRRQQYRWNRGLTETARKHLPAIWRSTKLTLPRKAIASLFLTICAFGPLLGIALVTAVLEGFIGGGPTTAVSALAGLAAAELGIGGISILFLGQRFRKGSDARPALTRSLESMVVVYFSQLIVALSFLDTMRRTPPVWMPTPKQGKEPSLRARAESLSK